LNVGTDFLQRFTESLMIDVAGLRKIYDDHLAVDGLSFSLAPGQVCGLVGPNGAGKTTTLRSLAGLLRPTEGTLSIAGCDPQRDEIELKRRVAYVPDDPPLFDDLSVQAHLELIGRLYHVEDYHQKAADLLAQFDLLPKAHAGTTTLSRGMRQKLAVCCVYLFSPQVLLLDEPLTGLDPPGIRTLLDSIGILADSGTTVIISSHLLAMIEDVCTHLLVMKDGQAQYFGAAADLRHRYPNAKTLEEAFFAATDDAQTTKPIIVATEMTSSVPVGARQ
jgi:ABC-2 type transport system ATP-binding protein